MICMTQEGGYNLTFAKGVTPEAALELFKKNFPKDEVDSFKYDYGLSPNDFSTITELLKAINFDVDNVQEDELWLCYTGAPYRSSFNTVLEALAPAIKDGCFLHFVGEEGDHFRYVFQDGKCSEESAKIAWPDSKSLRTKFQILGEKESLFEKGSRIFVRELSDYAARLDLCPGNMSKYDLVLTDIGGDVVITWLWRGGMGGNAICVPKGQGADAGYFAMKMGRGNLADVEPMLVLLVDLGYIPEVC